MKGSVAGLGLLTAIAGSALLLSAALASNSRAPSSALEDKDERKVDYLREVRPILANYCFSCHGPDEATREKDLRLDQRANVFEARRSGAVVQPGDPANSLLISRMRHGDAKKRMPPPDEARQPSENEIALLEAWIRQGADWKEHWAFVPPVKPPVPSVTDARWVRDPLDAFVRARQEAAGLAPRPEATREAWLRRVSLDLTGLPPTTAELDEFLADSSAEAFEKQVDRLLASPRYGERQAHEWLDLARYADTSGYQNDEPRQNWKWREWVIHAFNANMPFDQFTVEQLAGDLLPNATLQQKVATGFNRNHPTNSEAGEEEDEYRSAYVIDRVNTTSTAFMGLTLACTQCHDHKYDALSQRDYYSFYSFFNNVKERDQDYGNPRPRLAVPNADQEPRLADHKARMEALKARLEKDDPLVDTAQREWERRTLERLGAPIEWTTLDAAGMLARNGSMLTRLEDGSILSGGTAPVKDVYDLVFQPGKKKITALKIELLPDPATGSLGRASDGRFALSALELRMSSLSESEEPPLVLFSAAQADLNQKQKEEPKSYDMYPSPVDSAIVAEPYATGGKQEFYRTRGWCIVDDELKRPHEAVLVPMEALETNEASVLRLALHQNSTQKFKSLIARFRIRYTEDPRVREQLLPVQGKLWSALGPFAAEETDKAFSTVFAPEKELGAKPLDLKKNYDKVVLPAPPKEGEKPDAKAGSGQVATTPTPEAAAANVPATPKPSDEKPAVAKAVETAPAESKPAETKPVEEKPATPKVADAAPTAPAEQPKAAEATKPAEKPAPPEQITWQEQRTWRDGAPAKLEGSGVAWYVTRKVHSTRARTAWVHVDGPAGFRLWLNGEPVQAVAPEAPRAESPAKIAAAKEAEAKNGAKPGAEEDDDPLLTEPEEFGFFGFLEETRSKTEKRFRMGLREGENELVLKLVFAKSAGGDEPRREKGGGSFTFRLEAEGEDVINWEVASALRKEASGEPDAPIASEAPVAASGPSAPERAAAPKTDKVGELAAPLRFTFDVNTLTPSERRRKLLREHYRSTIDPVGRIVAAELASVKQEERDLRRQIPETLVMEELETPRQAYIFGRGLYKNRGENVAPGTPAALPPMDADLPRNRLGLARWLVSGKHPLTARVLVNRIWQQYFGLGLVRTPEDFGVRAELPTHPELLDFLALELVESGWDLKRLHRRIVLSATYRQDATVTPQALELDPENRLLARGPRQRLTAEFVRDQALFASGLLFEKLGGESVKPRQPKNAWRTVEGNRASTYVRHRDERQYRRSVYVYWKRGAPYPSMLNFDAAKRDSCTVTRATTTTPLQALTLLNDPVYVECAKMLGQRLLKDRLALGRARDPKPEEQDRLRLAYGFRLLASREPTAEESAILVRLLGEQRAIYKADVESAKKLLAIGDAKVDPALDPVELAAWTNVANALFNLDAALHRG
ncbi:MAG: DUF1553 domain-containing protein [Planctomycetota bacterium]|nr:DUF1553 domain-containing protein [Planctomycetota bacterium]